MNDDIPTVSLKWVRGGQPFEASRRVFVPSDFRAGAVAKAAVLKEMTRDLAGVPDEVRGEILDDARKAANIAMMDAILHAFICRVDPTLRSLSAEQFRDKLTQEEYQALADALGRGAPGAGPVRPLGQPTSSTP